MVMLSASAAASASVTVTIYKNGEVLMTSTGPGFAVVVNHL
jgi:hypothetical protein